MFISVVDKKEQKTKEIKFEDLEPGTVFQFDGENGPDGKLTALKLQDGKCVLLTFSSGSDWFVLSDGSIEEDCEIIMVWGKLVGVSVQHD